MTEAFQILKKDHKKAKSIISELLGTSNAAKAQRRELLAQLKEELKLHEKIEETLLYPSVESKKATKELALEAYEEHHLIDVLLEEMEDTSVTDEHWKAKLTVLQANLEHHIQEEEDVLFPKAAKELGEENLEEMAAKMKEMKEKS
jgi:iron-sulfur cluster repair protein YtfE (RIC family)